MTPFFAYAPFDLEVARKLASLEMPPGELAMQLFERLPCGARLRRLWATLETLSFDDIYPGYLTHPARLAASFADEGYDTLDDAALALCHNVREAGVAAELAGFLGDAGLQAVGLLTIDRVCERDPSYLAVFYDALEADTRLLVLKGLDKLDNTLWWPCFDVEDHDISVVLDQVCPRLEHVRPRLASYLRGLVGYVLSAQARSRFAVVQ